ITSTKRKRVNDWSLAFASCWYSINGFLIFVARIKNRHKRFLRNAHLPDHFHPLLALFLLFEQFAFSAHVAAVAFGGDIFAQGFDGFTGNDFGTDGCLDRNFEEMSRNFFLQPADQSPAP